MAIDLKYGNVTVEKEPGNKLGEDEPVILFRARDVTVPALLEEYAIRCEAAGSPQEHLDAIDRAREAILNWQAVYPDLVKIPD